MGKELEENREHSFQVKRRRMLQFESEVLDSPSRDEMFLRSKVMLLRALLLGISLTQAVHVSGI